MVLVVAAIAASGSSEPSLDDVPTGLSRTTIDASRDDLLVTLRVRGSSGAGVAVTVCPGILPGPSDAAGLRERIRVSGCLDARPDPAGEDGTWQVDLAGLDEDVATRFDAAERWLVVVTDPSRADDPTAGLAAAWMDGGPLTSDGPLLP